MSARTSRRLIYIEYAALVTIVTVFLLPVAWLITTAYKPARDIFSFPPTLAFTPTLENFSGVFHCVDAKTGKPHWTHDMLSASWGTALVADGTEWGRSLYRPSSASLIPHPLTAIPYYAWDNRQPGQMRVWIQEAADANIEV